MEEQDRIDTTDDADLGIKFAVVVVDNKEYVLSPAPHSRHSSWAYSVWSPDQEAPIGTVTESDYYDAKGLYIAWPLGGGVEISGHNLAAAVTRLLQEEPDNG